MNISKHDPKMMNEGPSLGGGGCVEGEGKPFFGASTEDGLNTLQNDCTLENIHSNL
jgi:hypothetical protein